MKRIKSFIAAALVVLLSAALILPITACHDEGTNGNNTIYVTSMGGMALQDVNVELFDGGSTLGTKQTDKDGKVNYDLNSNTTYRAKLSGVPAGFITVDSYEVKGSEQTKYIRLDSKIIAENAPASLLYKTGDVLYDFEETYYTYNEGGKTPTPRTAKLSAFFAGDKKAVLLDFFYNNCSWCNQEAPILSAAYAKYSDKLEILGINDYDPTMLPNEYDSDVQAKVQSEKVPYFMCKDDGSLIGRHFRELLSKGYPTAIMIDRYGILCDVVQGANLDQTFWENLFEKYTSDDYSQNVSQGEDPGEAFVPDVPGDFPVSMPDSSVLNSNTTINKTGRNLTFSADRSNSCYGWPWDLTSDQTAIYPTNSGHRGTMAVIYVQIDLNKDEVLAFDYKLSTMSGYDYLYISLDSRTGTGRQVSMVCGVREWQTGYSYAAQEAGRHEIEFSYYKSAASPANITDDKVYINNLRIVSVDSMNADLTDKNETFEVPYFATRSYNNDTKQFATIESVYLANDGYYHIGTEANASVNDPYLLLDVTHSTPYFGKNSENLYTLINSEINKYGGMYINSKDYTDTFRSYISFSSNSAYTGLIPVTQEIRNTITTLYNANIPKGAPYYSKDGWLQFCVYYKQYGIQQELSDPIKGLAYFSAFDTVETTGLDMPTYVEVEKGKGQFIKEDGKYIDVEGTNKASDGNYNLNEHINKVHFETVFMPRGYMYKFTPSKSGVYSINGIDCYYYNNDESVTDDEATDAFLYDGSLKVSHAYAHPIAFSDSDRYERNNISESFKIIHYLEAGKSYYINVSFRVVETTGDFAFRIDYLGEEYSYISQAASNSYALDENSKMVLPLYCDPAFDDTHKYSYDGGTTYENVWYDKNGGGMIYVDLTQLSSMFDRFTAEEVMDKDTPTAQYKFKLNEDVVYTTEDDDGNIKTVTVAFDLEKTYGGKDKIPEVLKEVLKKYPIADYTDTMNGYLALSKAGKLETSEEYGLVPVNEELYSILQLYNAKFFGYDSPDEWLKACCFRLNVNANNHG
ncbi:MAG: TlpA family protein disulfide reductase [Clostridia bacterium]|nr:TlpA family protein disulfide reductase [Clostridia bacterium]